MAAYSTTQCLVINLESGAVLTELANTSSSAYYWVNGVILMGYKSSTYESLIDGDGSTLNIKDGAKISVSGYCISGNANYPGTTINITGGTLDSTYDLAIYHPQVGTLNVSGGSITAHDGYSAIEMRAGTLNVTGGSITADASEFSTVRNSSGSSVYGAAIAISQHVTKQSISVYVTGDDTIVTGYYALYEANIMSNDADDIAKVTIHIDDGTFKSTRESVLAVYSQDCQDFVCHGTFISNIDEDIDDEYLNEEPCSGGTIVAITVDGQTDVHSIKVVDSVEATCLEDGIEECYTCTYCEAYFTVTITTDDDGNESTVYTEVEESDVVIPATGHDYDYDNGTWTWTETDDGYTVTFTVTCTACGAIYEIEATVTSTTLDDGSVVYTAVAVDDDGNAYSDTLTISAEGDAEDDDSVQTSDSSNIALMGIILLAAIAGCAGVAVSKRR